MQRGSYNAYSGIGIYATTIHHDSFNVYMFDNYKGNAVLLGKCHHHSNCGGS
jgi:hypothetical protein